MENAYWTTPRISRRQQRSTCPAHGRDATMVAMSTPDSRARWLDMEASIELQHGHHAHAERLAQAAAELRGAA